MSTCKSVHNEKGKTAFVFATRNEKQYNKLEAAPEGIHARSLDTRKESYLSNETQLEKV